jgi:hypothetical protein
MPYEPLEPADIQACWDWRQRWGAVFETREPRDGRTLPRIQPVQVSLIEVVTRRAYNRLAFARALVAAGRLNEGER